MARLIEIAASAGLVGNFAGACLGWALASDDLISPGV